MYVEFVDRRIFGIWIPKGTIYANYLRVNFFTLGLSTRFLKIQKCWWFWRSPYMGCIMNVSYMNVSWTYVRDCSSGAQECMYHNAMNVYIGLAFTLAHNCMLRNVSYESYCYNTFLTRWSNLRQMYVLRFEHIKSPSQGYTLICSNV